MNSLPTRLVGVNTKTYPSLADSRRWLEQLADRSTALAAAGLFVAVPPPVLPDARAVLAGTGIAWAAQNTSTASKAASIAANGMVPVICVGEARRDQVHLRRGMPTGTFTALAGGKGHLDGVFTARSALDISELDRIATELREAR